MTSYDQYIFFAFVFSPLVASMFITLIPAMDTNSKLSISRFFAAIGAIAFIRIFIAFLDHKIPTHSSISFSIINFNINLTLSITKYNIFLYGTSAAALLANMYLHDNKDTKTNIHQVTPFILTFFLYISLGQSDLRVALPILSIATFLIYFLIAYTDKIRRGSTIFQMGIYLFSCDALALVLLQIPFPADLSPTAFAILNILLLAPGLARISLPMFAPFTKKLLFNIDEEEGPFLISFLQLAGFSILLLVRSDLGEIPSLLTILIASMALIGALYISCIAIFGDSLNVLPHYFFIFYSSFSSMILFVTMEDIIWYLSASLILANIICFFHANRTALTIRRLRTYERYQPELRASWFISLVLLVGLPGLGIGTSLWAIVFQILDLRLLNEENPLSGFYRFVFICWLVCLSLLSFALVLSIKRDSWYKKNQDITAADDRIPIKHSLFLNPVLAALLSLLVPITTLYAANKGL